MNYRFMRLVVFFDLPMETPAEKRAYTAFRKFLVSGGFIMLQKSVYSKLVLNSTVAESVRSSVRKNKPKVGLLQMLEITEKQFSKMEYLLGEGQTEILDSDRRFIEL